MPVITIPKALRDKLGDEAAESFAVLLKEVEHEGRKDALVLAEEKFERRLSEEAASLKVNISEAKAELETKLSKLETKFETRISEVKTELETKISEVKAEIIKWMFIFWAGQIIVLTTILQIFFRK